MRASALLLLIAALAACSGPRPEAVPAPPVTVTYPDEPAPPSEPAPMPPSTYEPAPTYEPTPEPQRQVDGFRVQVYASESSAGGEQARSEAEAWWTAEQRRTGFEAPLDAYVVYLDGLYKVRMGAFTNRPDAESALALVRTRFPDAFLIPDLVAVDG